MIAARRIGGPLLTRLRTTTLEHRRNPPQRVEVYARMLILSTAEGVPGLDDTGLGDQIPSGEPVEAEQGDVDGEGSELVG